MLYYLLPRTMCYRRISDGGLHGGTRCAAYPSLDRVSTQLRHGRTRRSPSPRGWTAESVASCRWRNWVDTLSNDGTLHSVCRRVGLRRRFAYSTWYVARGNRACTISMKTMST